MIAFFDAVSAALIDTAGSPWIYLVVFAVCVLDGLFPPVPSESVVVASAAVGAATGQPWPWLVGIIAIVGAFAGDTLTYALGRAIGVDRFAWMRSPRVARTVEFARRGLAQRGASLILVARYIPVGRVVVNLTAGATRYPRHRFVPLALIAAASWAVYSMGIGLIAGAWLKEQPLIGAVVGATLAVVIGLIIDRIVAMRHRRADGGAEASAEQEGDEEDDGDAAERREEHDVACDDLRR